MRFFRVLIVYKHYYNAIHVLFLKVMIHTPEDFPDISSSYKVYSELNQSSRISVSVSHIQADKSLQRLNEKDRKCFLFERRSLKDTILPSIRSNSEDNCFSKCRLMATHQICNCTPYYFEIKRSTYLVDSNLFL